MTAPNAKVLERYAYTSAEIDLVASLVRGGASLTDACRRLGFNYASVSDRLRRMGIANELQKAKREARRVQSLLADSPKKRKVRNHCCTCGVKFPKLQAWAYCSKKCELGRKATKERPEPAQSCRSCAAFCAAPRRNGAARNGTCRINPPSATGWPLVTVQDWCLRWQARPSAGLLAGGGAAGGDGGGDSLPADAKSCGNGHDRGVPGGGAAEPEVLQGSGGHAHLGSDLAQVGQPGAIPQQFIERFGGSHARQGRQECRENLGAALDFVGASADTLEVRSAPAAANLGRATAAGASPEPQRNETMTLSTVPAVAPQLRAAYVNLHSQGRAVQIDGCDRRCELLANGTIQWLGAPVLEDAAEWDANHPGVAPTADAMLAVYADVADDVWEQWEAEQRQLAAEDFDDSGYDWHGRREL